QQPGDAPRRRPGVEAGVFLRRADQDTTVRTRHDVARPLEQDRPDALAAGVEQGDLPTHRADARPPAGLRQQLLGPRPGGDQYRAGAVRSARALPPLDAPALAEEEGADATAGP